MPPFPGLPPRPLQTHTQIFPPPWHALRPTLSVHRSLPWVVPCPLRQFVCDFGAATFAALHVDDHLVCQVGANAGRCGIDGGNTPCNGTDNPLPTLSRTKWPIRSVPTVCVCVCAVFLLETNFQTFQSSKSTILTWTLTHVPRGVHLYGRHDDRAGVSARASVLEKKA